MLESKKEFIGAKNILEELQGEIAEHDINKQQLCQRNSELAAILTLIPDTYFRLDAEGNILDYKPGQSEYTERLAEIIPGKPLLEYLPPHIRGNFHQAIAQVIQTKLPVNFTYNFALSHRICTCEARLLSLQSQEIIVLIREVKQAIETEFLHGNINFQTILQNDNNIIYIFTNEGRFSYVSPNWTKILGHDLSEVIGQSFVPFIHPDDVPHCVEYLSKIVNTGENQEDVEYRVKHKDGSWRWHTSNATTIKDANGKVLYCLGIGHDITARKLTEEALAERVKLANFRAEVDSFLAQSSSLQEMMQGCTEAIVKHLNAAFARIWTLNKEENILELQVSSGMYTHINGPHRFVPVGKFKIGLIAEEGKPHLTNSVQTDPRVGNKEWAKQEAMVAFAGYPLIVEGETLGVIAMFSRQTLSDSTFESLAIVAHEIAIGIKRKQTEEALRLSEAKFKEVAKTAQEKAQQLEATLLELQQTQVQLIHTEKMSSLGQLVAGIAHEINNPVNFIYGNINHAREYVSDLLELVELYQQHYCPPVPEIHEHIYEIDLDFLSQDLPKLLDSINLGAERIRQIVLSLRNFSRIDEDGMKSVDIHEGIDSTLLLLQNRLKPKTGYSDIKIIKQYGNLPKIACHAGQINQVFMNLLANAIDALEEGLDNIQQSTVNHPQVLTQPQILIHTELTADQQARIRIVDNGPGMTEEVRTHLFDPFFTTKPIGKGTGMGLSISYQIIVNKHQGKLECISTPGKGAEFIITIPSG